MVRYTYDFFAVSPTEVVVYVALGAHLSVEEARGVMQTLWNKNGMKPGQFGGWKRVCAVRTSAASSGPPTTGVVQSAGASYAPGDRPVECFNGYQFFQPSPGPVVVTCGEGFEWVESQQKCMPACPPGVKRDELGNCIVIFPYQVNKTFRQPGYDQVFAMPVAPPFAGPRVVRWVDPGGIPKPKPMPMARLWPGTPAPYVLLSGALGQAVTDQFSIGQAKAALFAWNQSAQILSDYGMSLQDVNPNWTPRDGIILHAFSVWWNPSHPSQQLPLGSGGVASAELTAAHLAALQQYMASQVPSGFIPPPLTVPTPAQGQAQAACALACEQKYGITSGALNPTALATCLQQCAQGQPVAPPAQPTLPTPPTQPTLPPAKTAEKSGNGLLIAGGIAAALLVGTIVLTRNKSLAENPKFMGKSFRWPSIEEVARELRRINQHDAGDYGDEGVDVRLNVQTSGWQVLWGDPQYDQDHRGFWGLGSVPGGGRRFDSMKEARQLLSEAKDDYYQQETYR